MKGFENITINNKEADLLSKQNEAPFSDEVVEDFNAMQKRLGLYTCMGYEGCEKSEEQNYGLLTAEKKALVCPCGKYIQTVI